MKKEKNLGSRLQSVLILIKGEVNNKKYINLSINDKSKYDHFWGIHKIIAE